MKIKKKKGQKKRVIKRNIKFRDNKRCLKPSQIKNKINYLEKKKIDVDCLKEDKKEFIKKEINIKIPRKI